MGIHHHVRRSGAALLTTLALGSLHLPAAATAILFIGNSLTFGAPGGGPPVVRNYRPGSVTDVNDTRTGGVPALFKAMTVQAGLDFDVSLAATTGAGLDYHYNNKHNIVVRPYDIVLLQGHSMLDASRPGHAGTLIRYAGLLAAAFHAKNPNVDVRLMATWSRADQAYRAAGSLWFGQPVSRMALDVREGCDAADSASDLISGVIPVGEAWNRAIARDVADPNPYDGIGAGQVNLWAPDGHHASVYGYYLAALTIFGDVTKRDPRTLGAGDQVARDLGISAATASALQGVSAAQLQANTAPRLIGPDISQSQRDLFEAALIANDQAGP